MAIKKEIAFEGLTYNLNDVERVAAAAAWDANLISLVGNYIASGSGTTSSNAAAASGQLFVTGSGCLTGANVTGVDDFLVVCIKK